jgi:hypothetical protein
MEVVSGSLAMYGRFIHLYCFAAPAVTSWLALLAR